MSRARKRIAESLLEDLEALSSPNYRKLVAEARAGKKRYSSDEVKKMLNL